jgi:hypothetical protein
MAASRRGRATAPEDAALHGLLADLGLLLLSCLGVEGEGKKRDRGGRILRGSGEREFWPVPLQEVARGAPGI